MDKRFNTLSVPEQLLLRKQAVDDVLAHPEWSLAQAVRHLKKTMRLTTAEMSKLSGVSYRTMQEIEQGYHYRLMRRAIDLLDGAGGQAMTLEEIAGEMNMSPAHFQRIFSRWAGVSPKRYQQWLALDHARDLLASRHTTLETADAVGLSGSGRRRARRRRAA